MSPIPSSYGSAVYGVGVYTSASTSCGVKKLMAKFAMNADGLSVDDKITKGRTTLTAAGSTEGAPVLGVPAPGEVAGLLTATDTLEAKRNKKNTAVNDLKLATQEQAAAEDGWDSAFG